MTDNELSSLLQEWKRTPAPPSLRARVFGSRTLPSPVWWDRIPASVAAAIGALAGGLAVWVLIALVPAQSTPVVASAITEPRSVISPPAAQEPMTKEPPPEAKSPAVPTLASTVTVPPRLIKGSVLAYPADFAAPAPTTTLKVAATIDKDGRVITAYAVDGDPMLQSIALKAVHRWLYEPRLVNGEPAAGFIVVDVVFEPRKKK